MGPSLIRLDLCKQISPMIIFDRNEGSYREKIMFQ